MQLCRCSHCWPMSTLPSRVLWRSEYSLAPDRHELLTDSIPSASIVFQNTMLAIIWRIADNKLLTGIRRSWRASERWRPKWALHNTLSIHFTTPLSLSPFPHFTVVHPTTNCHTLPFILLVSIYHNIAPQPLGSLVIRTVAPYCFVFHNSVHLFDV